MMLFDDFHWIKKSMHKLINCNAGKRNQILAAMKNTFRYILMLIKNKKHLKAPIQLPSSGQHIKNIPTHTVAPLYLCPPFLDQIGQQYLPVIYFYHSHPDLIWSCLLVLIVYHPFPILAHRYLRKLSFNRFYDVSMLSLTYLKTAVAALKRRNW